MAESNEILCNLDDEIYQFDNQFNADNKHDISLETSIDSILLRAKLRKSLSILIRIPDGYPLALTDPVTFDKIDFQSLKSERRDYILEFIKKCELELNSIIEINKGQLWAFKVLQRALVILENDLYLQQCFEILESQSNLKNIKKNDIKNQSFISSDEGSDKENKKSRKNIKPKKIKQVEVEAEELKLKLKGADFIFQRIKWDLSIDKNQIVIGYLDRFLGVQEIVFTEFKGVHEDRDGIPLHRIRYFKINEKIVWDRENRIDLLSYSGDVTKFFN